MSGLYILIAGLNGAIMVALAAYGAHGTNLVDPSRFQTAWQLHAVHTAVLVAFSMCGGPSIWLFGAFWLLIGGTALFSGSLYGLALGWWLESSVITPIGGLMLIGGWLALAISGLYRLGYTAPSRKRGE